jgi:ubiquinone/menaquinone biosynthesis C-methylase UbiE
VSETYRSSHQGKGTDYEEHFSTYAFRRMSWRWEKQVLDEIASSLRREGKAHAYLDFACGTGRILGHLEDRFDVAAGVDLSSSMLRVARDKVGKAELILADITRGNVFEPGRFDFVTAFRFFANAEPALRTQAVAEIAKVLRPGGYFVFNNHRNCASLTFRLLRLKARLQRAPLTTCMHGEEVLSLCQERGLRLLKTYRWGVIPGHENHMLLPERIQYAAEKAIAAIRIFSALSTYQIFILQKT